jgi:hypothetical protein
MSDAIRPRLTSRDIFRGPFWLLGHRLVTFACLIPAWMVAHEAQQNYQDPTGPFIMTLLMLVTLNLLCRGIANRLGRARLNFSGQVTAPPKAALQTPPQPVTVAVSRHGGPNLRQVVRSLPPEIKAMLK